MTEDPSSLFELRRGTPVFVLRASSRRTLLRLGASQGKQKAEDGIG